MRRTTFILALVCGILAAPLLCDAGITAHECVCDVTECCDDEATCELDPCDVVYEKKDLRTQDRTVSNARVPVSTGATVSAADDAKPPSAQDTRVSRPFPPGDLPLRI